MEQTLGNSSGWIEWMYEGVDHTLPGNGGEDCVKFIGVFQRIVESVFATLFSLYVIWFAYPRLTLPNISYDTLRDNQPGKRLLLVIVCLTFGIELGFKFATRQFIWVFNPCHLATIIQVHVLSTQNLSLTVWSVLAGEAVLAAQETYRDATASQIYLLAAPPSKTVTVVFRLHMHMLTGAPIAILFPVVNTRLLPMETEIYYIQHILMLVTPFYLLKTAGPYIPENLLDFTWGFTSLGILYIYHFLPLQLLAYFSAINLNNMLCPAVSDPFHGPYYRLFALAHQTLLIPCLGKVYVLIANYVFVWDNARGDNSDHKPVNSQNHHRENSNGHIKST